MPGISAVSPPSNAQAASRQRIETGETADADRDLFAVRGSYQGFDALQNALVRLDVDAGGGVRKAFAWHQAFGSASCSEGGPGTWSDFRGISNCILSISSCCGTGTGYDPSKQARQNSWAGPRPIARMSPGIER